MKIGEGGLIYNGIHETLNGKMVNLLESIENDKVELWDEEEEIIDEEEKWVAQEKEIQYLKTKKKDLEETVRKQEQQIEKLQGRVQKAEEKVKENVQELGALRSYVYSMSDSSKYASKNVPKSQQNRTIELWKDQKVLVVGGHIHWQNKLKERFPKWQFVQSNQSALVGHMVKGKDIIICNTSILDHSCYYKMIGEKEKQQQLYYVHCNNIEKCIAELEGQMG